jgi:hypothetical protein
MVAMQGGGVEKLAGEGPPHKPAPNVFPRHAFEAMSVAVSTRREAARRIATHVARSNIHFGSSSQRRVASPSRLQ